MDWFSVATALVIAVVGSLVVAGVFAASFLVSVIVRIVRSKRLSAHRKTVAVILLLMDSLPFADRLIVHRDERLEQRVVLAMSILKLDGIAVPTPRIRVLRPWLTMLRRWLPFEAHATTISGVNVILVNSTTFRVVRPTNMDWILYHEMGRHVEFNKDRSEYRVLNLLWDEDPERRADAFAWYCIQRICTFSEEDPQAFDWDTFLPTVPIFVNASRKSFTGTTKPA